MAGVSRTTEAHVPPRDALGPAREPDVLRITPSGKGLDLGLRELWSYRELLYFLIWRDVKVRYKQVTLGVAWVVIQPIVMVTLFSLLFGRFLNAPSNGAPYAVFVLAALMPWQLFVIALNQSANSLVANQDLITKIHFPRILLPVAAVFAGLIEFGVAFLILVALLFYHGIEPSASVLLLPLFLILGLTTALALGILLSALNARYRDVQHLLPTLTQFWFFATPIAYSSTLVPESWRTLLGLNPMAGVAEGFRWALLDQPLTSAPMVVVSFCLSAALALVAIVYFQRTTSTFADVV